MSNLFILITAAIACYAIVYCTAQIPMDVLEATFAGLGF
jgi:hypothetical protein